ncbi:MAG: diacylglycerol kinase [Gammaproteobacteria bacterium]|jgi:diacylglycerol kinase (ATP)
MSNNKATGLKRLINAAGYSWQGLRAAWQSEAAFRQEVLGCAFLVPIGIWMGDSGVERALLVSSLMLVPIVELLNSAIESVVDRQGNEYHPLSGQAKDMGSAAVLISILVAVLVWVFVLFPRF